MKFTKRTKELVIDIFVKMFQILFASFIVGSYISGAGKVGFIWIGFIACSFCVLISYMISVSYKEE